jgi:hypothetical protein
VQSYELLGRKWDYVNSVEELVRERSLAVYAKCDAGARSRAIEDSLLFPCLRHLGFSPVSDSLVQDKVNQAVDQAVEYFAVKWWTPDVVNEDAFRAIGIRNVDAIPRMVEDVFRSIDKARVDRKLVWYDAFTSALFLGALAARWDDIARICSWFTETSIEPEYTAGMLEDQYQQMFVYIGCSLNPCPPPGMDELLAEIKKCRLKRPRLLCATWEAIQSRDQRAFDKAFIQSVDHFLSKPGEGQLYKWVDTHRSALLMIGEHHGLECPTLTERQRAAIVTRESAGMLT